MRTDIWGALLELAEGGVIFRLWCRADIFANLQEWRVDLMASPGDPGIVIEAGSRSELLRKLEVVISQWRIKGKSAAPIWHDRGRLEIPGVEVQS